MNFCPAIFMDVKRFTKPNWEGTNRFTNWSDHPHTDKRRQECMH